MRVLAYSHLERGWEIQDVDVIEWMAGVGMVEQARALKGLEARAFEIERGPINQDFLGDEGFMGRCHW